MRKWRKILLWVLSTLASLLLILFAAHCYTKSRLTAYQRKLTQAGEKLRLDEINPNQSPASLRAGQAFLDAATPITNVANLHIPFAFVIHPGHAAISWKRDQPLWVGGETNIWPKINSAIASNHSSLHLLQSLAETPLSFPVNYAAGANALFPQFQPLQQTERAFTLAAIAALHGGNTNEALTYLKSAFSLIRNFPDDKVLFTQYGRAKCGKEAFLAFWETLQSDQWTDDQLAVFSTWWEQLDFLERLPGALIFERNHFGRTFEVGRSSITNVYDDADGPIQPSKFCSYYMWNWIGSYEDERLLLQMWQGSIPQLQIDRNLTSRLIALQANQGAFFERRGEWQRENIYFISSHFYPAAEYSRSYYECLEAQSCRNLCLSAIALQRYHLLHHAYPEALVELVPQFLKEIPCDYMDGKNIRYHRDPAGTFSLYSVGADGKDNGGVWAPERLRGYNTIFAGADLIWPKPATGQEISEFINR